jgi:leader peptidase (prepilin peptidase)/N-methyltransferase
MMEAIFALLFGLLIGSFLNVCIYRWPRDLSVVKPRSHCTACEKTIAWYDNIPLVSFVVLGGRCRHCQARISLRYPLVELATGLLFFASWEWAAGNTPLAAKMCLFMALMVGLIFSDLEERILPDELTLGGLLAGLALAYFVEAPDHIAPALLWLVGVLLPDKLLSLAEAVLGAALPAFFLWAGGWLYEKVRHRQGLGFGDVKLIAMVGAFLGLRGALLTLILGSMAGSLVGYAYIKLTHKDAATYELPFGTFLGLAGMVVAFAGARLFGW